MSDWSSSQPWGAGLSSLERWPPRVIENLSVLRLLRELAPMSSCRPPSAREVRDVFDAALSTLCTSRRAAGKARFLRHADGRARSNRFPHPCSCRPCRVNVPLASARRVVPDPAVANRSMARSGGRRAGGRGRSPAIDARGRREISEAGASPGGRAYVSYRRRAARTRQRVPRTCLVRRA